MVAPQFYPDGKSRISDFVAKFKQYLKCNGQCPNDFETVSQRNQVAKKAPLTLRSVLNNEAGEFLDFKLSEIDIGTFTAEGYDNLLSELLVHFDQDISPIYGINLMNFQNMRYNLGYSITGFVLKQRKLSIHLKKPESELLSKLCSVFNSVFEGSIHHTLHVTSIDEFMTKG